MESDLMRALLGLGFFVSGIAAFVLRFSLYGAIRDVLPRGSFTIVTLPLYLEVMYFRHRAHIGSARRDLLCIACLLTPVLVILFALLLFPQLMEDQAAGRL